MCGAQLVEAARETATRGFARRRPEDYSMGMQKEKSVKDNRTIENAKWPVVSVSLVRMSNRAVIRFDLVNRLLLPCR